MRCARASIGCSPCAAEAMCAAIGQVSWYNDPEAYDLRGAIARHHGVALAEVLVGAGIDEMLGNVVHMLVEPGTPVVTSRGAYPTFNYHVAGYGGALEAVPYRDDTPDLDALLDAVRRTAAPLVYLANPDNSMGTYRRAGDVRAFVQALPQTTLLVLDEAYVVLQVVQGRDEYYALAARLGLACVPSATNFVCIDVGGGDRARTLLARLQDDGVFVRMPGVAPLDRCVRVTVGTAEERQEDRQHEQCP